MTGGAAERPGRCSIGVLAKTPLSGFAKTRLIPLLGAERAAQLQRDLTWRTLALACAVSPDAVVLWTDGDPAHPFWEECRHSFRIDIRPQQGADLGARMDWALTQQLRAHPTAIVLGTDAPVLRPWHVARAAVALDAARMVFIPAEDGGYVLVGAAEPCHAAFSGIEWGSSAVMAQTRSALGALGWQRATHWSELPMLWDLDRPEDFRRAVEAGLLPPEWAGILRQAERP